MDESYLYQKIAESIRQEILSGRLQPGDRLPAVRQMCARWNCTPGTVQRAYNELARQGLLVSRAGQGTQVGEAIPPAQAQTQTVLRQASLVHRAEAFLLETLTAGHTLDEVQTALQLAMDRWRTLEHHQHTPLRRSLRFVGSHDPLLNALASQFSEIVPGCALQIAYAGSQGGLQALAEGRADLAGCHLWDPHSGSYNRTAVQAALPGRKMALLTLSHRRLGLILPPGNPLKLSGLSDLAQPRVRFVNRQPGSGTRVWLDAMLSQAGIDPQHIQGYSDERLTHSDVARAVAEGAASSGLGLESAALAYGLDFIFLTRERYDLVAPAEALSQPPLDALANWLASPAGQSFISRFPGYENQETGQIHLVDAPPAK